jgi:hypothetical protein
MNAFIDFVTLELSPALLLRLGFSPAICTYDAVCAALRAVPTAAQQAAALRHMYDSQWRQMMGSDVLDRDGRVESGQGYTLPAGSGEHGICCGLSWCLVGQDGNVLQAANGSDNKGLLDVMHAFAYTATHGAAAPPADHSRGSFMASNCTVFDLVPLNHGETDRRSEQRTLCATVHHVLRADTWCRRRHTL